MSIFTFTEKMERGTLSLNIPTDLAIQSLLNIHPDRNWPKPPVQNYSEYWLNARTLYRNILSSFTSDISILLSPGVLAELMVDEWKAICTTLNNRSQIRPYLYLCNYKALRTRYFKHTVFKGDTTPKQVDERKRMEASIKQFLLDLPKDECIIFDTDIKPDHHAGQVIIQTHLAVDLLSARFFEGMELLESYTGNIKNRSLWYTKYNNGKDLVMIPFTQYFLRVFGDKEFFSPKDGALRRDIIEIATKNKWGPLTTDGKVKMNLEQLKNPYFKAVLKDMM